MAEHAKQILADAFGRVRELAAVRLVSVIGDAMQHAGQAGYVRSLADRRDKALASASAADH
jgi:hypothetical protein